MRCPATLLLCRCVTHYWNASFLLLKTIFPQLFCSASIWEIVCMFLVMGGVCQGEQCTVPEFKQSQESIEKSTQCCFQCFTAHLMLGELSWCETHLMLWMCAVGTHFSCILISQLFCVSCTSVFDTSPLSPSRESTQSRGSPQSHDLVGLQASNPFFLVG